MRNTKTALVTGASSDVGQAVAISLASCGFNVAAHYHSNVEAIHIVQDKVKKYDTRVEIFCHNLVQPEQSKKMVDAVVKQFGSIDVLINTIGPFYYGDILEVTPEEWSEAINMNLHIAFNVTYFAREYVCTTKGHIINFAFSGVQSLRAWRMATAYGAAKAGIVILTKSLAASLAASGVRVNLICPGLIEGSTTTEQERQNLACQVPLGRLGKPEEIAQVVKWLVTESPSYLTGSLISVAGAWE